MNMIRFRQNKYYDAPKPEGGAGGGAGVPDPKSFIAGAAAQNAAADGGEHGAQGGQPQEPTIDQYWKVFSQRVGTTEKPYEMPEHIRTGKRGDVALTPDDYFDELASNIVKSTRFEMLEQEGLREYRELYEKDKIPFAEYAKTYVETNQQTDYSKMSNEEILAERYTLKHGKSEQNPNGLSSEQITSGISEMSAFEQTREVEKEMSLIEEEIQTARAAKMQEIAASRRIENKRNEDAKLVEIAQIEQSIANNGYKVNNIELGESRTKELLAAYRELSKLDENGNRPLYSLFNDENVLFNAFVSVFNDGAAVADHIANKNNSYAQSILARTSLSPEKPHSLGLGSQKIPDAKSYL